MPFIPSDKVVQVFMEYLAPGGEIVGNVLNFKLQTGVVGLGDMDSLGNEIVSWFNASDLEARLSSAFTLQALRMRDLTAANSWVLDYTTGLPIVGDDTNEAMPNNVTWCIKLATGHAGRSYRGRLYVVGLTTASTTGNLVDTAVVSEIVDTWQLLIGVAQSAGFDWGVLSLQEGGAPRAAGVFTPITDVTFVDRQLDTQRRRMP